MSHRLLPSPLATSIRLLLCVGVMTIAAPASRSAFAQGRATASAFDARVVSTEWLAAHRNDAGVVVIDVTMDGKPGATRIPGSRAFSYRHLSATRDGIQLELPALDSLRVHAEEVGISQGSHVVVYAHEAPMATRFLLSMQALGLTRLSYLNGGLVKWEQERRPVERGAPTVVRGTIAPLPRDGTLPVVNAEFVLSRLGKAGLSLIDTRTTGEYNGTGNRSGMPSAGHLQGARQLEWEWMFDSANPLLLKPESELRALFAERVRPNDLVVTYCWVGYRASATWFVASALGLDVRLYDGSYQDWQKRKLPTTAGGTP